MAGRSNVERPDFVALNGDVNSTKNFPEGREELDWDMIGRTHTSSRLLGVNLACCSLLGVTPRGEGYKMLRDGMTEATRFVTLAAASERALAGRPTQFLKL